MKKKAVNTDKYLIPFVEAALNIPTLGFAGAFIEISKIPYKEQREKRIVSFIKQTMKKIDELELNISENEFKKRLQKPEFIQLFIKILSKIQHETRIKLRQIYSNFLVNLVKEEAKVNFDKKIYYLDILETLNEDHLKILSIFYKDGVEQNTYPLRALHDKMGCYVKRKIMPGESVPISKFVGKKQNNIIRALDPLKGAYLEGLLGDLNIKRLIRIETEITSEADVDEENDTIKAIDAINSEIHEKYVGNKLGSEFYNYLMKYN